MRRLVHVIPGITSGMIQELIREMVNGITINMTKGMFSKTVNGIIPMVIVTEEILSGTMAVLAMMTVLITAIALRCRLPGSTINMISRFSGCSMISL